MILLGKIHFQILLNNIFLKKLIMLKKGGPDQSHQFLYKIKRSSIGNIMTELD